MRKFKSFVMSGEEENAFLATVDVQYFRSPAITGVYGTELKLMAINEVSQVLHGMLHKEILNYMIYFWYEESTWEL